MFHAILSTFLILVIFFCLAKNNAAAPSILDLYIFSLSHPLGEARCDALLPSILVFSFLWPTLFNSAVVCIVCVVHLSENGETPAYLSPQVFHAKHMRSSATTYLTALAFADSLFLLTVCLFYSPRPIIWLSTNKDPNFEVRKVLRRMSSQLSERTSRILR